MTNSVVGTDYGTHDYPDEGCAIHPSCLTCVLPRCIHDLELSSSAMGGMTTRARRYRVVAEHQDGTPKENALALALSLEVDERTAWRLLKQYNESGGSYVRFVLGAKVDTSV